MSAEENKARIRRFYDGFNKGKEAAMAAVEEFYAPGYVYHGPPGVFGDVDLAGLKQKMMPAYFTAFPDQYTTVDDLIAEGDKVVQRYTCRATHQGELMGVPATGKVVTWTGIAISRFADGKCMEEWGGSDFLGLMQQIGAIPQMTQGRA